MGISPEKMMFVCITRKVDTKVDGVVASFRVQRFGAIASYLECKDLDLLPLLGCCNLKLLSVSWCYIP